MSRLNLAPVDDLTGSVDDALNERIIDAGEGSIQTAAKVAEATAGSPRRHLTELPDF